MSTITIKRCKTTASKGPFPRGAKVAIQSVDAGDKNAGFKVGMTGTVTRPGEFPIVEMDRPVKGDNGRIFVESQLVLARYYKPKGKRK